MTDAWYTSREDVMSAQDIKAAAYAARDIDRAIESGARAAEALLHRAPFAPTLATRYFDYPGPAVSGVKLYLGQYPLISATAVTAGGVAVTAYNLEPVNSGPPYTRIEIDRGTSSMWQSGLTSQRAIAVTGLWGWSDTVELAGATTEALDSSETGVDGSGMPGVGVGSIIRVDSERMIVTDRGWISTGQSVTLTANNNAQTLAVADGTAFVSGETLLVEAERMRVVDIAGNNLTVKRAMDGTTLAAHASATVYAMRLLTVQRGALGTTAATHLTSAPVYRWVPPGLLSELNLAYAVNTLLQRQSGYARVSGTGESERQASGRGLWELEREAKSSLGRVMRTAAV